MHITLAKDLGLTCRLHLNFCTFCLLILLKEELSVDREGYVSNLVYVLRMQWLWEHLTIRKYFITERAIRQVLLEIFICMLLYTKFKDVQHTSNTHARMHARTHIHTLQQVCT